MMIPHVIRVRNVNTALLYGLSWLAEFGSLNGSRNGSVLVAPGPVLTLYERPQERVMFSALRDANPFFHLYECIWMLAGRQDAASVARYAKTMESFAEGGVLAGSYGHRWRRHFEFDQLPHIAELLRRDPKTRRAVLTMWDPVADLELGAQSKDVPCNTHVYFDLTTGVLNMTVGNRSNDIVWGAYGANAVHMSFLQEVVAAAVDVPVGAYLQVSNNFHTYLERPDVQRLIRAKEDDPDGGYAVLYEPDNRYTAGVAGARVRPVRAGFFWDLDVFLDQCQDLAGDPDPVQALRSGKITEYGFLRGVVRPLLAAHKAHKDGDTREALILLEQFCEDCDWKVAAQEWLKRRLTAQLQKEEGV